MRFIHTADVHLDSPLVGLASYPDAPAARLRTATRDAFSRLVDEAIREDVDFMVIAGDLYDGPWKDVNTGVFFAKEMGRLNRAGIPAYVLYGNHDAESEQTRQVSLPANVHVFSAHTPSTFTIDALQLALHGLSFKEAATTRNLVLEYPDPKPGWFNIGVLHTALEGNAAHPNYAPCSVSELEARGYDYWALGHVHEHQVVPAKTTIVFPGNLQGRHARELGPRGAVLVTTDGARVTRVDRLFVDVLRWHRLEVPVDEASDLGGAMECTRRALEGLVQQEPDELPLAIRVTLVGKTNAHRGLVGLATELRDQVIAVAASVATDRLWIEKVLLETKHPASASGEAPHASLSDLSLHLRAAAADAELQGILTNHFSALVAKLPSDLLNSGLVPELEALRRGDTSELTNAAIPTLLARLGLSTGGES